MTLSASVRSLVTRAYLRRLALSKKPIVVGPWRSELGFEVLYFLPFLAWAMKTFGIDQERLCAVSRGGMGVFYPAKHNLDLYTLRTVDQVRLENQVDLERQKMMKQIRVTDWDRAVVKDAATKIWGKDESFHVLHPSWMYWLFAPVWDEQVTTNHVALHTHFSGLPVPELPENFGLPKEFVAVRFYERHTFPLSDPVGGMVRQLVQNVASRHPVVLLNQDLFADDHTDLPIVGHNIHVLPKVQPEANLIMQGAVLARAAAFIGTYGGVAQWALRYGKPSLSFYTQFQGTAFAHRNLSQILAARMNVPFELADLRAIKLHEALYRPIEQAPHSTSTGSGLVSDHTHGELARRLSDDEGGVC